MVHVWSAASNEHPDDISDPPWLCARLFADEVHGGVTNAAQMGYVAYAGTPSNVRIAKAEEGKMTEIMPEDRERIWAYVRDDLPMWETEPAIGAITYVRASIADELRRKRDRLLDHLAYVCGRFDDLDITDGKRQLEA